MRCHLFAGSIAVLALTGCGSEPAASPSPPAASSPNANTPATTIPATTTPTSTSGAPDVRADGPVRIEYGSDSQQFAVLSLPADASRPLPVVVLIHGGFWRTPYDLTLMDPLAADLNERGYAVWNLEYRRIGDVGGAWPGTLDDVAAGVDALADAATDHPLDLDRVAIVGHSAGGHLALWSAGRTSLPADAPGTAPAITPAVAIGQGAVVDLASAATDRLGNGAVVELLGGSPDEFPDRYTWATPNLGTASTLVSVVGSADGIVPPAYSADPLRPDGVEVITVDGADHFDLIDPTHEAWMVVVSTLDDAIGT